MDKTAYFNKNHPLVTKTAYFNKNHPFHNKPLLDIAFLMKIVKYPYVTPLGGLGNREWPTRMCGHNLWLKPFKGGYSRLWRVVNYDIYFNSCIVRSDFINKLLYMHEREETVWAPMGELIKVIQLMRTIFHWVTCNFTNWF